MNLLWSKSFDTYNILTHNLQVFVMWHQHTTKTCRLWVETLYFSKDLLQSKLISYNITTAVFTCAACSVVCVCARVSLTSMAVLKVWALTENASHTPYSFMSTMLPVSPSIPQVRLFSTACFACHEKNDNMSTYQHNIACFKSFTLANCPGEVPLRPLSIC